RGSGVPSKPTRSTSTPCAASACAWYCMRALRPRSPSATTAALIQECVARGCPTILPAMGVVPKAREQIRRDALAILGRRTRVVDRRNLVHQHLLSLGDRRAAAECGLGLRKTHDGRGDAAQGDAR